MPTLQMCDDLQDFGSHPPPEGRCGLDAGSRKDPSLYARIMNGGVWRGTGIKENKKRWLPGTTGPLRLRQRSLGPQWREK